VAKRMSELINLHAEQSVIGGMLINGMSDRAIYAIEKLRPDDFSQTIHRYIWSAILEMSSRNDEIDLITLMESLRNAGHDIEFSYLGEITKNTPSQANMRRYAEIVKDYAKLRNANAALHDAMAVINETENTPEDKINSALSIVSTIGADDGSEQDFKTASDLLTAALDKMEIAFNTGTEIVGLSSGFENIDAMTGGFRPADLIILAARPSMGKTTLAMNIAENVAYLNSKKGKVLVISLEMPGEQIMNKSLSRLGGIYLKNILNGSCLGNQYDPARLSGAMEIITASKSNMIVDDKGGQHISQIQARAKRAKMKMGGLDLVVIDYLQMISADGESQTIRIGNVSKGLKDLAKALNCPVIALSQLNRALVGKPELKNLRDSGSIEQDADVVMFLHDEDYEGQRGDHSLTEVIFAKQRMAAIGSTFLQPELQYSRFADTKRLPEVKQEEAPKVYKKRYD
jgi:replicative DNA helicase